MSKILVLPGTIWQVPLMKKIKAMGHELFLVNPVKNLGVCEIADHFFQSDIFSFDAILDYCKKNGIDVVMSEECDIATNVVAQYNEALGARHLTKELAELFTNKFAMREFCLRNEFNPIPHQLCVSVEEAEAFLCQNGKSIIKPVNSNASHGVFVVESNKDIEGHFHEASAFSRNEKTVLIEKYIEGTEFTVDGIMTSFGHKTLAISEKKHYRHNPNIANSLVFTHYNSMFDYDLLRRTNDELINATKLPYGITHVEYKYCDGVFYLIEMAARGGGNLISASIVPFMSGVDNYFELVNSCLNANYVFDVSPSFDREKIAVLKFLDLPCKGGIVSKIEGLDYLDSANAIKSYKLNFQVGDYIKEPENDSVRAGYYIVCASTRKEYDEVVNAIKKNFKLSLIE